MFTEETSYNDQAIHATPEREGVGKRDLAHRWTQASEDLKALSEDPTPAAPAWYRPMARKRRSSETSTVRRSRSRAQRDLDEAGVRLEVEGVGSTPGQFGVLTILNHGIDNEPFWSLEATIRRALAQGLLGGSPDGLLEMMAQVRVSAELDQSCDYTTPVEERVLELAESPATSVTTRRRLLDHLPGVRRPIAAALEELQRTEGTVWLRVSTPEHEWGPDAAAGICIDQIEAAPGLKGHGFGTEALIELCRFADTRGLSVAAEVIPDFQPDTGFELEGPNFQRLAQWYWRHGFRQGSRPPHKWKFASTALRQARSLPKLL